MTLGERWTWLRALKAEATKHERVISAAGAVVAAFLAFEIYFLRELLAAEFFFMFFFALLGGVLASLYLIGVACERGFGRTRTGTQLLKHLWQRASDSLEVLAANAFRHHGHHPVPGTGRTRP